MKKKVLLIMTIVLFCGAMLFGSTFLFFSDNSKSEISIPEEAGHYGLDGYGTEDDPFLIQTFDDFYETIIEGRVNDGYWYLQTTDIDCDGAPLFPLDYDAFRDFHYNGGGFSLKNVYIELNLSPRGEEEPYSPGGLFGNLISSTIENLTIDGGTLSCTNISGGVSTTFAVGVFAGALVQGSNITNCHLKNFDIIVERNYWSTTAEELAVGGIVGLIDGGRVEHSTTEGVVIEATGANFVGGIVGDLGGKNQYETYSLVENCKVLRMEEEEEDTDNARYYPWDIYYKDMHETDSYDYSYRNLSDPYIKSYFCDFESEEEQYIDSVGGCVGIKHSSGQIGYCYNEVAVEGRVQVGGIVGSAIIADSLDPSITSPQENSYLDGSLGDTVLYVCVNAGTVRSIKEDSYSTESPVACGGICGYVSVEWPACFKEIINYGHVVGSYNVGGFVGFVERYDTNDWGDDCCFDIRYGYNTGTVTAIMPYDWEKNGHTTLAGGLIGDYSELICVANCYNVGLVMPEDGFDYHAVMLGGLCHYENSDYFVDCKFGGGCDTAWVNEMEGNGILKGDPQTYLDDYISDTLRESLDSYNEIYEGMMRFNYDGLWVQHYISEYYEYTYPTFKIVPQREFAPTSYAIMFNGNGATSGEVSWITYDDEDKEIIIPDNGFRKDGHWFQYWTLAADDASDWFKPGEEVPPSKLAGNAGKEFGDLVTLYAYWEPNVYSLNFCGEKEYSFDTEYGKTVKMPYAEDVGMSDVGFIGWATTKSATTAHWKAGDEVSVHSIASVFGVLDCDGYASVEIYAVSEAPDYMAITVNTRGGQAAIKSTATYNTVTTTATIYAISGDNTLYYRAGLSYYPITSISTSRSGYSFLGWGKSYTTIPSTIYITGDSCQLDTPYSSSMGTSLYAVWEATNAYEITVTNFSENENGFTQSSVGGKVSVTGTGEYGVATTIILSSSYLSKVYAGNSTLILSATPNSGYLFVGWGESEDSIVSTDTTYTFTVTEKRNINAYFKIPSNVLKYDEDEQYYYFEDGYFPQSYVGDTLNSTINTASSSWTSDATWWTGNGTEMLIYCNKTVSGTTYNLAKIEAQETSTVTTSDGESTTFTEGSVYWFLIEPIRWRVSDYGVENTPNNWATYGTTNKNFTVVSDTVLWVSTFSDSTPTGDYRASNAEINNIFANMTNLTAGEYWRRLGCFER